MPLVPVRAARAPRVVPTGHGAGAGRRASRSTSRARPGTPPLARAGRRAASWTGRGTSKLRHFDNTSRRRANARYGLGSSRHSEVTAHRSPAPDTNDNSDPESGRATPPRGSPPGPDIAAARIKSDEMEIATWARSCGKLRLESKVKGKQENSTQDFESYEYRNISRLLSDAGPME